MEDVTNAMALLLQFGQSVADACKKDTKAADCRMEKLGCRVLSSMLGRPCTREEQAQVRERLLA